MNAEHWNPLKHKSSMMADMVFFACSQLTFCWLGTRVWNINTNYSILATCMESLVLNAFIWLLSFPALFSVRTLKLDQQPHLECIVSVWISCSCERDTGTILYMCISVYIKIFESLPDTVLSVADVDPVHLQAHRLSLQVNASDPLKEMLAFSSRDRWDT